MVWVSVFGLGLEVGPSLDQSRDHPPVAMLSSAQNLALTKWAGLRRAAGGQSGFGGLRVAILGRDVESSVAHVVLCL